MTGMEAPQPFFEWSTPDFSPEVYAKRRENLQNLLQADGGVMLIPSRHGPDDTTFRQNDTFNYFTGLELPESFLVVDGQGVVALYLPRKDARFIAPNRLNDFPGRDLLDSPEFCAKAGVADLRPMDDFASYLATLSGRTVYLPMESRAPIESVDTRLIFKWDTYQGLAYHLSRHTNLTLKNGHDLVAKLRMVKDAGEVALIRRAVEITEDSILDTLPLVRPGVDERTLIGYLEYGYRRLGSQRVAFDSIVKGGANSHCPWRILGSHYDRRNQTLVEGDAVVFDVGAEYCHYSSDIGRTFPVGETFTQPQIDALWRVHDAVNAVKEAIRPGITLGDLKAAAHSALVPDQRQFMSVDSYFGHHIGLSVGDPCLMEAPLEPGMVFTIEPWYYNHRDHVSVFTEENIVVTETGLDVLSKKIPYDPDSLTRLRQGG